MLLFDENGETQPISVTNQWAKWDNELSNYSGTSQGSQSSGWNPTPFGSSATSAQATPSYVSSGGGGSRGSSVSSSAYPYQYIAPQLKSQTSTTSYSGGGPLPTMTAPKYNLPEYDYGRINYLAQQQAAPLYSKARNALTTGIGKVASTDNPYMQGQARKQLMSGYGGGLSEIAAGAARTGAQLYAPEYAGQMQKATSEYGGELATSQSNFQAALAEWQKSLVQTTTSANTYNEAQTFNPNTGTFGSGTSEDDRYEIAPGIYAYRHTGPVWPSNSVLANPR